MAKKAFLDGYKQYDPTTEGYGNPSQWREAFYARMGVDEAERVKADAQKRGTWRSEYQILGVSPSSAWNEIQTAFRKMAMNCHPDRTAVHGKPKAQADEEFKTISAAYALLGQRYGK